jgi:hypothetical protein
MFVANFIYLQQECCGSEISRATLVLNLLWESLDGKGQFLMNFKPTEARGCCAETWILTSATPYVVIDRGSAVSGQELNSP